MCCLHKGTVDFLRGRALLLSPTSALSVAPCVLWTVRECVQENLLLAPLPAFLLDCLSACLPFCPSVSLPVCPSVCASLFRRHINPLGFCSSSGFPRYPKLVFVFCFFFHRTSLCCLLESPITLETCILCMKEKCPCGVYNILKKLKVESRCIIHLTFFVFLIAFHAVQVIS